ncbi:MAG: MFS transporter [Alphaproteobacteria bacterium]|nr:MFS transporter [Alphaproteobacteria bacterium]
MAADPRRAALLRDTTLVVTGGMFGMTMALVAPALPGMLRHFADTPDIDLLASLVVALPTALLAVTAPLAGWLADRTGRQLPLIARPRFSCWPALRRCCSTTSSPSSPAASCSAARWV